MEILIDQGIVSPHLIPALLGTTLLLALARQLSVSTRLATTSTVLLFWNGWVLFMLLLTWLSCRVFTLAYVTFHTFPYLAAPLAFLLLLLAGFDRLRRRKN